VISAFTCTLTQTCRCGRTSNERCHGASPLSVSCARSAEQCRQPRSKCLWWFWYIRDSITAMQYWSASQPTWYAVCSRCSRLAARLIYHLRQHDLRCIGDTKLAERPRMRAVQNRGANVQSASQQRAAISGNSCFLRSVLRHFSLIRHDRTVARASELWRDIN